MKSNAFAVAILFIVVTAASCKEDSKTAVVWGSAVALGTKGPDGTSGPIEINGAELAATGADLVGYCRYKDEQFSFAFGTDTPTNISGSSDYYFSVVGIDGPPAAEPYGENGLPLADETRTFTSGEIRTSAGAWRFTEADMKEGRCLVIGFAQGGEGNLTPIEYGKQPFDYLVNINCEYGLDQIPSELAPEDPGSELGGFKMTVWFKDCES